MGSTISYLVYRGLISLQKRRLGHRSVAHLTLRDGRSFLLPLCRFIPSSPATYVGETETKSFVSNSSEDNLANDFDLIDSEATPQEFRKAINFPIGEMADLFINVQPLSMNVPQDKEADIPKLATKFARSGVARAYLYETNESIGEVERAKCHVFVKWAKGKEECDNLWKEANLYETVLKPLQGEVVPICYGFFRDCANDVACLVLEDCGFEGERKHDDEFK